MKTILSLIISAALVVSGYSQTRNVLVGTNNTVVQPTNFWSADASNARAGLGLGTAATSPASAFQPSSATLSNLASSNGGSLTNIRATNLVGIIPASNIATVNFSNLAGTLSIASGGTSATNAANARQNLGSTTVGDALFIATNAESARTTIGATTVGSSVFTLANPSAITFIRVNSNNTVSALTASDFRTALSLGTAATNPSSAFQPSSTVLSNLANSNGASLTNISVTNLVGALATNGSAAGLTNFPASLLTTNGNGAGLTNLTAANITGTVALASNLSSPLALTNGGTGATNASTARTNLGLGWSALTNIDASNFRTDIGLGWSALTNTNATNFRNAVGLGDSNQVTFNQVDAQTFFVGDGGSIEFETSVAAAETRTNLGIGAQSTNQIGFSTVRMPNGGVSFIEPVDNETVLSLPTDTDPVTLNPIHWNNSGVRSSLGFSTNLNSFLTSTSVAVARTNLGIPLAALTNTNNANFLAAFFGTNTNPVLVNTNGDVVSPTNFWQVAPIVTRFIETQPTVNQTTNIAAARNLHIHSLAISVVGVTNTIALPITNSFNGDVALVVHQGPTSSVTAVRTAGAATNIITLNQFEQTVEFIYYDNVWQLNHNQSFIEPIFFSGTNASANAAASRTNLGLGATNEVVFQSASFGSDPLTLIDDLGISIESTNTNTGASGFTFVGNGANKIAENTRAALNIPLPALTNTNNANFQAAVFATNTAPTNTANTNGVNFNTAVHWMEVTVQTNGSNVSFRIPLFK